MKISEILHKAADEHLWDGTSSSDGLSFTCLAVGDASIADPVSSFTDCIDLIKQMGLDVNSFNAFDEFERGPDRQGARYLWLKFAALVAEDEGL